MGASVKHCVDFPNYQSANNPYELAQSANTAANSQGLPFGAPFRHSNRKRQPNFQNCEYFRGCISLPLFLVSFDSLNDFMNDQETARAFSDCLAEMIFCKQILNVRQIDLTPYIHRRQALAMMITEGSNERSGMLGEVKKVLKANSNWRKDVRTLDEFTGPIVLLHSKAVQLGHLCAVHSISPSKVFVAFGGFKNMMPLVEKISKSNLTDITVNRSRPGCFLKWIFRVLNTMLQTEPAHIEELNTRNNLLLLIKHMIIRLSKYNLLTKEVVSQLKNVFRENLVVRACVNIYEEANE